MRARPRRQARDTVGDAPTPGKRTPPRAQLSGRRGADADHPALLAHCRAGFEGECAGELQALAADAGIAAWCAAETGSARVLCVPVTDSDAARLAAALALPLLVFARDRCLFDAELPELPERRVETLVEAGARLGRRFAGLRLETADGELCRPLLPLCRKLHAPLAAALREAGLLVDGEHGGLTLHVHLLASRRARLGVSSPGEVSPWNMGIPRLRMPRGSPSRSALKLEEALHVLLPMIPSAPAPTAGRQAVDLGAAPGGWSLLMAGREMQVIAVDNAALKGAAHGHPGIDHVRADGFHYSPARPVDWLLCDMVESPSRVATLVARWLAMGWCRAALFNLKLPMKRRLAELRHCRALLVEGAARPLHVRMRQLYHDREEVTVLAVTEEQRQ